MAVKAVGAQAPEQAEAYSSMAGAAKSVIRATMAVAYARKAAFAAPRTKRVAQRVVAMSKCAPLSSASRLAQHALTRPSVLRDLIANTRLAKRPMAECPMRRVKAANRSRLANAFRNRPNASPVWNPVQTTRSRASRNANTNQRSDNSNRLSSTVGAILWRRIRRTAS